MSWAVGNSMSSWARRVMMFWLLHTSWTRWKRATCLWMPDSNWKEPVRHTPVKLGRDWRKIQEYSKVSFEPVRLSEQFCYSTELLAPNFGVMHAKYNCMQNSSLFPEQTLLICGCDVPLLMLGDPAYPLLPILLKPFSDNGCLTPEQFIFNNRLSSCCIVVEHAFGRPKSRWRLLYKTCDHD